MKSKETRICEIRSKDKSEFERSLPTSGCLNS
jgi:hypothetical protein